MIDLVILFAMVEKTGEAAAEGGGDNFLMLTWLMPTVTLLVLILWNILDRVFFKPLRRVLDERYTLTFGKLAEAQELLEKIQKEQERYEAALTQARQEANQLMADVRAEAERQRAEMIDRAREETRAYLERARHEIEQARDEAIARIAEEVDDLVYDIVRRVLGRVPEGLTPEEIASVRKAIASDIRLMRVAS